MITIENLEEIDMNEKYNKKRIKILKNKNITIHISIN
jgi:hypothetical protein